MKKLLLFDCDQTIWTSGNHDYMSSVVSPLVLMSKNTIYRINDANTFILRPEVGEMFKLIQKSGNVAGIVSDNKKDMVITALKLFDIFKFINPKAVNVKLWKGYCPKHKMVEVILGKKEFKTIPHKNVYWFDDKDYSEEAKSIGVNFVKMSGNPNIVKIVKKLID